MICSKSAIAQHQNTPRRASNVDLRINVRHQCLQQCGKVGGDRIDRTVYLAKTFYGDKH